LFETRTGVNLFISGIDEAGRGPVLGPMVMAIASFDVSALDELKELGVKDSKMLTAEKREEFYPKIIDLAEEYYSVKVDAYEIDKKREKISLNLIEAKMAVELINLLRNKQKKIYIDCPDVNTAKYRDTVYAYLNNHHEIIAEHHADVNYVAVSGASIIAKVERDRYIKQIEKEHGIEIGSGYPHDPKTIAFIKECVKSKSIPKFVRKSWQTFIDANNATKQKRLV